MSNILTSVDDHSDEGGESHLVRELLAFAWGRMTSRSVAEDHIGDKQHTGMLDGEMLRGAFDSGIAGNTERRFPQPPTS